jgi:hypothetical protein
MSTLADLKSNQDAIASAVAALSVKVDALKAGQVDQSTVDAIATSQTAVIAQLGTLNA